MMITGNKAIGSEEMYSKVCSDKYIFVNNYLEVAGLIMAMKSGVYWKTVLRPIDKTRCI